MADLDAERIANQEAVTERILGDMDARVARTILGPDGRPLLAPIIQDKTVTYAVDGESATVDPEQLLMRAARMQRDGASLKRIRRELDLVGGISDTILQSALNQGHAWLKQAIAEGREPAESRLVVGYEFIFVPGEDDDD